jgi:ankyrin repeat protein
MLIPDGTARKGLIVDHSHHPRGFPTHQLREHPDIEQLKTQAKELLAAFRAGEADASAEVNAHFRGADREKFPLHDAQLVLARSYGFDSWPKLKAYLDGVTVQRLAEAVRAGDIARVRAMLEVRPELASLDMAENNEHRALHYAVFARSPEMVRLLMEYSADARQGIYPHRDATSPYTIAVERGYKEIVAVIEEEEEARHRGRSSSALDRLVKLIADGDEAGALSILEADPALVRDREGWMLLSFAARRPSERLVSWLLAHGVSGRSPGDGNARGPRGLTPLDRAASAGVKGQPIVKLLLAHGAEMTSRGAVALGDADWLKARQAEGRLDAPLNWPEDGRLTIAVKHDQPEILKLLLDFDYDPNERVRLQDLDEVVYSAGSPLYNCADAGKLAMAEILLERGADPNVHVYAWGPPVHRAYLRKDQQMIGLMKRHGGVLPPVSIGLLRENELAKQMLSEEAAGRLLPAGILEGRNVSEDLLRGAADSGNEDIVRMALPGVDWDPDDERWHWILLQAVWAPSPECLGLILARCNPNLRHPRFGRVLLHDVAALGSEKTVEQTNAMAALLLDAGANINERDDVLRSTPLGWACRWGRLGLVKLLLDRGADPMEAEAEPWATPRAWAEKMGHAGVVAFLGEPA